MEFSIKLVEPDRPGPVALMKIMAKSRREGAKLFGLVLQHRGILRHLGDRPCVIQVSSSADGSNSERFRAWNAGDKIYVECFIPSRRVSKYLIYCLLVFNNVAVV